MSISDRELVELRQIAQGIAGNPFSATQTAARHLVLSQGQHLNGLIASLAYRTNDATVDGVVDAFNDGMLARGYPMRGTIFGASTDDIGWITDLCGPRQLNSAAKRRAGHGIDEEMLDRALSVAGEEFARQEPHYGVPAVSVEDLGAAWEAASIPTGQGRRYHLIFTLMAGGKLVYGPITRSASGSALVHLIVPRSTWVPNESSLEARFNGDSKAAVTEFLQRYLYGHGPATIRDFAWWTKLPLGVIRTSAGEATAALEDYGVDHDGENLYGRPGLREERSQRASELSTGRLLAPFDELVLGYPNRLRMLTSDQHKQLVPGNNGVFKNGMLRAGRLIGTWRASSGANGNRATFTPFTGELSARAEREFLRAHANYPS